MSLGDMGEMLIINDRKDIKFCVQYNPNFI